MDFFSFAVTFGVNTDEIVTIVEKIHTHDLNYWRLNR